MSKEQNPYEITGKEIFKIISMPLKVVLSIALTLFSLSLFGVLGFFAYIVHLYETSNMMQLSKAVLISIVVLLLVLIMCILIIAFSSLVALLKIKLGSATLTNDIDELSTKLLNFEDQCLRLESIVEQYEMKLGQIKAIESATTLLASEAKNAVMAKYILDEDEITHLETNIAFGARIVVMTSKFILDTGKLLNVILDNICRGAIYEYLIPNDGVYARDFKTVYTSWWKKFLERIESTMENEKETCQEYESIQGNKTKAEKYFREHIIERRIDKDYSLVTIIMYQQEKAPSKKWEVIMKMPTVSGDNNYYAFKIPDEEYDEKQNLISGVESLCSNAKKSKLELAIENE